MPARIAFCITTLDTGGAERQMVEMATRLPRDRFEPAFVVLASRPLPPRVELVEKLAAHDIPVDFLGARGIWQAPTIYRQLSRWFHEHRPALVQCFLAHANVLGAVAAHRAGIHPIVTGIRVAEHRTNWHFTLQRWAARFVDRQACISQAVADFAEREMRLPRGQIVVIPNAVDVTRFENIAPITLVELGLAADRRIVLFVGRLESQKRPFWLLDRWQQIAPRLPQHDLVIAGTGPLQRSLERHAARLGIAERVHFVGWRSDVDRLLAAADLLVLTSACEGMPNVILEAMASARPVVATNAHGIAEMLGNDHDGQITPVDAPQPFVDAVARMAGNSEFARQFGQRNRERVLRELNFDRTVAGYVTLYESLLPVKNR